MPIGNDGKYRANPQQARATKKYDDDADKVTPGKGKLRCVRIEPAKNGFIVYEEREPVKKPRKGEFPDYRPPEPSAFGTKKEALDYADKCLG